MVSIHGPLGYGPSTLPLRHSAGGAFHLHQIRSSFLIILMTNGTKSARSTVFRGFGPQAKDTARFCLILIAQADAECFVLYYTQMFTKDSLIILRFWFGCSPERLKVDY